MEHLLHDRQCSMWAMCIHDLMKPFRQLYNVGIILSLLFPVIVKNLLRSPS